MKKQSRRRYIDKPYGSGTFITETKQAASSKAVGKKDSIKNFKSGPVKILSESDILQINNEYVVKRPTTQQREMVIAIAKKKRKKRELLEIKKRVFVWFVVGKRIFLQRKELVPSAVCFLLTSGVRCGQSENSVTAACGLCPGVFQPWVRGVKGALSVVTAVP